MNIQDIKNIVSHIKFNDWTIRVHEKNQVPFLQVQFVAPCNETGNVELQNCRKWQLSYFMHPSEVVRTAFKAVLAAVEHEASEQFTYKGVQIFHPHVDFDKLVDFMATKPLAFRNQQ